MTLAGLMMFGEGLAIRDEFDNMFMDYRDESEVTSEIRWNDRITYDGTWENNLFNFFTRVTSKLTADLKKPFKLEGMQRIDETPIHKAVREAFVNLIIHADYLLDTVTLKVIKHADGFEFTNPGILKLPVEDIYQGGNSKSRNPRMRTMLRMIGFGDNAGSGFPAILAAWKNEGWIMPKLEEDTRLNQVTLTLKMVPFRLNRLWKSGEMILENTDVLAAQVQKISETVDGSLSPASKEKCESVDTFFKRIMAYAANFSMIHMKETAEKLEILSDTMTDSEKYVIMSQLWADAVKKSAEKLAESAEKSVEPSNDETGMERLSTRQKQILTCMKQGKAYTTEEVAQMIGLKGPRTRQLLNELVKMDLVSCTAATKNRRYVKK